MPLESCWISGDLELPPALRALEREGWRIKPRRSARGLPEDVQILFCDPVWDGLENLCAARSHDDGPPPIVIVGNIASSERGAWIRRGADDAVAADCSTEELGARADAHFAKSVLTVREWRYGGFTFHLFERLAVYDGHTLELNGREYMLLLYLARADGRTIGKRELLRTIWGLDFDPGTNRIEVYIFRLRSKLEEFGGRELLKTHKGKGYSLDPS